MANKEWMTIKEYAKHAGKSPQYIRKTRPTKLPDNAWMDNPLGNGGYLIHVERADIAYEKNTAARHRPKSLTPPKVTKPKPQKKPNPPQAPAEQKKEMTDAGRELVSLNEAQTIKANYDAWLKELEYGIKNKELLPADDVKKAMADLILSSRSKILGIKGKLAPLLKEFVEDPTQFGLVMNSVEQSIRDILTEMVGDGQ